MKEAIVDEIMNSLRAPMILEELQQAWSEEQNRRQRFYEEMSEQEKVEFIKGEVVVHSPAKKRHVDVTGRLVQLLKVYCHKNDLGYVGFEKILIRLTRNDFEPDVCFFKKEKAQTFEEDQLFFPAPDLVVEVLSSGTQARDRGVKFEDYQLHGVAEYWIVDAQKKTVEQYVLQDQQYDLITKASDGHLQSSVVSGLTFPIPVIFDENKLMAFLSQLFA
ncbi:Uma2 family endonuclease [Tunicatimonas pelagia]|uniref:Uma2 family endonuclease n=1 Tax=Tunicatimonas pelagia TaxID=931531 RepID=UPI002665540A|nr:Uma2 family endonuclease [Tunicatimonas pelagia]WKN45033.1 Uma2 family endonuclease [Tunicatimonas pelagia]